MKTIVIKIGTSSICHERTQQLKLSTLSRLVESVCELRRRGYHVILVTSGAVGMGRTALSNTRQKLSISEKQALAAVGQGKLMALYDNLFSQFGQIIAQVLLTRNDIAERSRYLNGKNTLTELLSLGVIPIINENDTVSVSEIRFGDNDTLSAITAAMIRADWLFLLTDVECLYSDNPRTNPSAVPIRSVDDVNGIMNNVSFQSAGGALGTGGMKTKLIAANLATAAGISTIITSSQNPANIILIMNELSNGNGKETCSSSLLYTHFKSKANPMVDRKWWLLHGLRPVGTIVVDKGAAEQLCKKDQSSSLFAAGIVAVTGEFSGQECVEIFSYSDDSKLVKLGQGIVNYSSFEIDRIKGKSSLQIPEILGYYDSDSVIHRDNLIVMNNS